ncbi:MAG: hypothetical protein HY690_03280 [Chloroflexi bacterium]|nr:hypothetical protein [Chloroflexota bacterium]
MAVRESVQIDEQLHREIREHPEDFGLSAQLPKARRLAQLLVLGAAVARRQVEAERRRQAFAEWADDQERQETIRMMRSVAFDSGLI